MRPLRRSMANRYHVARLASMKGPMRTLRSLCIIVAAWNSAATAATRVNVDGLFAIADVRLRNRVAEMQTYPDTRWPIRRDVSASTWTATASVSWDSGYFPGLLWQMEERTGSSQYRAWATKWTKALVGLGPNDAVPNPFAGVILPADHDAGTIAITAFAPAFEATGDAGYARLVHRAAWQLQNRFNATHGVIRSWNWGNGPIPVIIDSMLSSQALGFSAAHGGDAASNVTLRTHSLTTAQHHVRADGSTYHLVDYNTSPLWRGTVQGYDNESTWTRGQAWAIHGFTESYRSTGDSTLLNTAMAAADYFLVHAGADPVPFWDLELPANDAPTLYRRDASAAAVAASGLIRLSEETTSPANRRRYFQAAEAILNRLASPDYLAASTPGETRLLLHSVGNFNSGTALDSSLIYADYYFLEALKRYDVAFPGPGIGAGDANRDGAVNFDDLLIVARNYGQATGQDWLSGDFDSDAATGFSDLLLLAQRYGTSTGLDGGAGQFAADWALARSIVPEPAAFSALAMIVLCARRRRVD